MLMGKRVYFLCVTGYKLRLIAADLLIQPLNYSMMFLKEKVVILTNDVWLIAIYYDEGPCEEVFSTIKEDLLTVENRKRT
jgi:hypothetical protein